MVKIASKELIYLRIFYSVKKTRTHTYQSEILKLLIFYTAKTVLVLHGSLTVKLGVHQNIRSRVTYNPNMLLAVTGVDEDIVDGGRTCFSTHYVPGCDLSLKRTRQSPWSKHHLTSKDGTFEIAWNNRPIVRTRCAFASVLFLVIFTYRRPPICVSCALII